MFEFESEEEAKLVLEEEGKKLFKIAQDVWLDYLESYTPQKYVRTYASLESIKLGVVRQYDEDTLCIELTYQDDLAYHPSLVGKSKPLPEGHAIMLISEGWHSKRLEAKIGRPIPHFTEYEGFNYVEKVIERYNSTKHEGISLEYTWRGKPFEKGKDQTNVLRG